MVSLTSPRLLNCHDIDFVSLWFQLSESAEEEWARTIAEEEARSSARRAAAGAAAVKIRRPAAEPFGGVEFASVPAGGGEEDEDEDDDDDDDEGAHVGAKRARRRLERARTRARAGALLVLGFVLYLPWLAGLCLGGGLWSKDRITRRFLPHTLKDTVHFRAFIPYEPAIN